MRVITVFTTIIFIVSSFNVNRNFDGSSHADLLRKMLDDLEKEFQLEEHQNQLNSEKIVRGDVAFRIQKSGMNYLKQQFLSSIRHDVLRFPALSIQTSYQAMGLNLDLLQVIHFKAPSLDFKTSGNVLHVSARGGHAKLLGHYSAVYKTKREGELRVDIDDIHLTLSIDLTRRRLPVGEFECSQSIGNVEIHVRPPLPPQITELIRDSIITNIAEGICPTVQKFAAKMLKTLRHSFLVEDPIQGRLLIPHSVITVDLSNDGGTVVLEKKAGEHHQIQLPHESNSMVSVAISEDYINEMLKDITDKGNIVFHLDRIPEVKEWLRLHCKEEESCVGKLGTMKSAVDGSGALEVRITDSPHLELRKKKATLLAPVQIQLTYKLENGQRTKFIQMDAHVASELKNIRIDQTDDGGRYIWSADHKIQHLEVLPAVSFYEDANPLVSLLPPLIDSHQQTFEKMMSEHIRAEIPVEITDDLQLEYSSYSIQHRQLTLDVNIKAHRRLFPPF